MPVLIRKPNNRCQSLRKEGLNRITNMRDPIWIQLSMSISPPQTVKGCSNSEWKLQQNCREISVAQFCFCSLPILEKRSSKWCLQLSCRSQFEFSWFLSGVLSHACQHLQPELWDIQISSLELPVGLLDSSHSFPMFSLQILVCQYVP